MISCMNIKITLSHIEWPFDFLPCFVLGRSWDISCSLSCVWSNVYYLWGWLHSVVIFRWRSFYIVWFLEENSIHFLDSTPAYMDICSFSGCSLFNVDSFFWLTELLGFHSTGSLGMEQIMRYAGRRCFMVFVVPRCVRASRGYLIRCCLLGTI